MNKQNIDSVYNSKKIKNFYDFQNGLFFLLVLVALLCTNLLITKTLPKFRTPAALVNHR
jgi:hypothetical protein